MIVIQEILGYFLIGIFGMMILAVFYLPIYFVLRKKIALSKQIAYFLFGVCVLVICYATFLDSMVSSLLEDREIISSRHFLNLVPFRFMTENWAMGIRKQITQTIANILMFLPLGFITPVAFNRIRSFKKTTISMVFFSFLIEFVQYFIGRSADIDDIMLNTLGGILGYLIFKSFFKLFKDKMSKNRKRKEESI